MNKLNSQTMRFWITLNWLNSNGLKKQKEANFQKRNGLFPEFNLTISV